MIEGLCLLTKRHSCTTEPSTNELWLVTKLMILFTTSSETTLKWGMSSTLWSNKLKKCRADNQFGSPLTMSNKIQRREPTSTNVNKEKRLKKWDTCWLASACVVKRFLKNKKSIPGSREEIDAFSPRGTMLTTTTCIWTRSQRHKDFKASWALIQTLTTTRPRLCLCSLCLLASFLQEPTSSSRSLTQSWWRISTQSGPRYLLSSSVGSLRINLLKQLSEW